MPDWFIGGCRCSQSLNFLLSVHLCMCVCVCLFLFLKMGAQGQLSSVVGVWAFKSCNGLEN